MVISRKALDYECGADEFLRLVSYYAEGYSICSMASIMGLSPRVVEHWLALYDGHSVTLESRINAMPSGDINTNGQSMNGQKRKP